MTKEFQESVKGKLPEEIRIPKVGILKEQEKRDLENEIVDRLKKLGSRLTQKDIRELMSAVETSKSLSALRDRISEKVEGNEHQEVIEEILSLANSIRQWALEGIQELRFDVKKLLRNPVLSPRKWVFFSEKFKGIAHLEESELGKNIIIDITGAALGLLDSAIVIASLLLSLFVDAFRLPFDLYQQFQSKKPLAAGQSPASRASQS